MTARKLYWQLTLWTLGLVLSLLSLSLLDWRAAAGAPAALATNIVVNSTLDGTLAALSNNTTCDLREAVTAANTNAAVGQCAAGMAAGADTISFSVTGTITLAAGQLNISDNLIISGPGAPQMTISGNQATRVFQIAAGNFNVTFSGLTIANGANDVGSVSGLLGGGGGIYNQSTGTVNITSSILAGNIATGVDGFGGAIYNESTGTVNVTSSALAGNAANGSLGLGGSIYNQSTGTVNITSSTLAGNLAVGVSVSGGGGGIYNKDTGAVNITGSTLAGNSAIGRGGFGFIGIGVGGGIFNQGTGRVSITNSTFSGNTAVGSGGLGGNLGFGGGIYNSNTATVSITSSTFSDNVASTGGGGISNENTATTTAKNTIIANNTAPLAGPDVVGTLTSQGYNLIENTANAIVTLQPTDITGVDPQLGPLQNNGGPTLTQHPLSGSPAIDKGNSFGLTTDQRGFTRPVNDAAIPPATGGDNADIGALEVTATNTAPMITGATLARQQGSPAANLQIATALDAEQAENTLSVTATPVTGTGVTVSGIAVDAAGVVTAQVLASCTATNSTFTLTVTDGQAATATATLTVNVTANTGPTVGVYPNTILASSGNTIVTPISAPSDNGTIANVTAVAPGFNGTFTGNNDTGAITIRGTNSIGSYTVTVTVTDNCGATTQRNFTLTVNTPPTINGLAIQRQQASPPSNGYIAFVSDPDEADTNLVVRVDGQVSVTKNGVTVNNIAVSAEGDVTADVAAACTASNATFALTVTDSAGATANATLAVTVTANAPPSLGTYPNTTVAPGGSTTVTPSAAPVDNGALVSLTAEAAPGTLAGTLTTNAATGQVTVNNADPPGVYTITVVASDNCGQTAARSFTLTVGTINSAPTISALTITRPQDSHTANLQIATVSDAQDTAQSLPIQLSSDGSIFGNAAMSNGVTVTLIDQNAGATGSNPNALGQVLADVLVGCGASSATFTLKVTDSLGAMTTTMLTVTVTPETQAPIIVCPANQVGVTNLNTPSAPVAITWPALSINDNCAGATGTCTPPSGATFPLGTTTVTCTATDQAGNISAACSFTVAVRQPRQASKDLISKVKALVPPLTPAQANELIGHLELANTYLERGQTTQACTHLQNFVNAVNAFVSGARLTQAQAQPLLDYADKIKAASGCPNPARAETVALFNGASGASQLKDQLTLEQADGVAHYSQAGDVPVAGDWDGDGTDTLGLFRHGVFYLRQSNQPDERRAHKGDELVIEFGWPGDVPVIGDWDGDGKDTIGVFRQGLFLLRNTNTAGVPDAVIYFGQAGDVPLAGDWDGDGQDNIGVYTAASGTFQLRNGLTDGAAELVVGWGGADYLPVVGDWDGDGITTIGLYGPDGQVLLRNTNTAGPPEIILSLNLTGGLPIVGKWAGQP